MWEPLEVSQHPAKFGGPKHCIIGEITILVSLMISKDHVFKGSHVTLMAGDPHDKSLPYRVW